MKNINIFILFLIAPFIGLLLVLGNIDEMSQSLTLETESLQGKIENVEEQVRELQTSTGIVRQSLEQREEEYREQQRRLRELAEQSSQHKEMSDELYEQKILNRLGEPIRTHKSDRVEIKVYSLKELDYRGYIAKVKLFDSSAVKVVLGKDTYGEGETTLNAVKRKGAILGINGGGFYPVYQDGKEYILPMGNTMIDGEFINGFSPSHNDLFFAGITRDGDLFGDVYKKKENLMEKDPLQGVSFVPVLIQDLKPVELPKKWQQEKQPRTILGEYGNGDLIMIVVDGRQSNWSRGVTLERLQIKLIELGVIEAYNLDGGGSSAFVYDGEVLNRPSDGQQRKVPTNIVVMP